jgi:sulfate permease, SulP family
VSVLWARFFPFLRWWPLVNRHSLRADLIAGLTNAVVALPQGMAFATIAGLPPVYGLYTAIVPPIVAALFGSSRHLITGPAAPISIVVFATISPLAEPGSAEFVRLAITMAFLAGAYQLILGLARMGALANFISHSVVVGFTAGAAMLIITTQLKHYFGVEIPPGESFLHNWRDFFAQLDAINVRVTAVGLVTLASAVAFMVLLPRWPGMLLAMIIGSLFAYVVGNAGIPLVGALPRDLPPLSLPHYSLGSLRSLGSGALAVAMFGLVSAVSIGRSIALKSRQRIDSSQEFIGQGLANIIGSFVSSYPASGSFTRSGLNYIAGAITPMAAILAAVALALLVVLVAPLMAYLPISAMSAIILIAAYRLIDMHHIRTIVRTSKRETTVLITTFLATLFVELEFAIYLGVILSLVFYLMRTSRPQIVARAPDPDHATRRMSAEDVRLSCPQLKIIRIDGSLFFGAVDHVHNTLQSFSETYPEQKHVLIIASGINFIDVAGAEMLVQEAERRRALGGGLYIAKMKPEAYRIFKRGGYLEQFGAENVFLSKAEAIAQIFKRLDRQRCERCTARIFTECQQVPYKGERPLAAAHSGPA